MRRAILASGALVLLGACAVGPDYTRPSAELPASYTEVDGWKPAQPADAAVRGAWWEVFHEPELDRLEPLVESANQSLAAAEARFAGARSLVDQARSEYYPTVVVGAGVARSSASETLLQPSSTTSGGRVSSTYSLPLDASWEIDLWGRVRREVESSQANADASGADLANTLLSLQTELAADFFLLQGLDAQQALLQRSAADYERSLAVTRNRYQAGVASEADVVQAEALLESTRASDVDVGLQRALLQHAIALLAGTTPGELPLPPEPLAATPPGIPAGVPSELLERRPDVAAAERRVAAANAQIGVARAAYYPALVLSASAGFASSGTSQWLTAASRFWSVGPTLSETVFDGGLRGALSDEARAAYDETVANYRQSVLSAMQETEDALASLRLLEKESEVQARALAAADESVRIALNQYQAGTINYLDVVVVETAELSSARNSVDIASRRMVASVNLVKALGGGWQAAPP